VLAFVVGGALLSYLTTRGGLEFIRHFAPWQAMFLIASIPGIIIAALILNLQEPARPAHFKVDLGIADAWRHVKQAGAAYGFHFCYGSSVYLLATVFAAWAPSFYVREFKVDNSLAALLSGAAALSGGPLGSWIGGTIMDRLLKRGFFAAPPIVIMLGLSLFLPACILFILSKNLTLSVIGYALAQFCILMGAPPAYAGVQMLTPERHRGLLAAAFHTICTLAALGGGVTVVGIVNDQFFAGGELGVSILIVALSFAGFGVLLATLGRSAFKRAASRMAASMPA
jgi:MFS family permease